MSMRMMMSVTSRSIPPDPGPTLPELTGGPRGPVSPGTVDRARTIITRKDLQSSSVAG